MLQTFLSDGRMREFLTQARTIAVVGAKDKEGQPVDRVGKYLIQAGYQVIPRAKAELTNSMHDPKYHDDALQNP